MIPRREEGRGGGFCFPSIYIYMAWRKCESSRVYMLLIQSTFMRKLTILKLKRVLASCDVMRDNSFTKMIFLHMRFKPVCTCK
jgi:hypothetical protein